VIVTDEIFPITVTG